jgi:hypothetical protein
MQTLRMPTTLLFESCNHRRYLAGDRDAEDFV